MRYFKNRAKSRIIAAAALAAMAFAGVASAGESPEHAVIVISCDDGSYELVSAFRAPGPVPKAPRSLRGHPLRVAVVSKEGKVLFEAGLRDPALIRGEFARAGRDGEIEGHHITRTRYTFAVRVPMYEGARLDLFTLKPKLRRAADPPAVAFRRTASFSPAALAKVLP